MSNDPTSRYVLLDTAKTPIGVSRRELTLMALFVLQVLMLFTARVDRAWKLPNGVGFAEHYGFFTIFAITPVILLLTSYILQEFIGAIREVDSYCTTPDQRTRNWVTRLATNHIERLSLRGNTTPILIMIMIAFALFCAFNVIKTIDPIPTYRHDVFDGWSHRHAFFAAKAYVFVALVGVWAMAVFVCLHVTYSMFSILSFLRRHDALQVNLFHRDNCGGTSRFGNINLAITAVYVCLFGVVLAMIATHGTTYLVVDVGFVAISVLTIAQTFGAVFAIQRVMSRKKKECLDDLATMINQRVVGGTGVFPSDLLSYRTHVMNLHTFPYARGTLAVVNTLRYAPIIVTIVTLAARMR